ncbi:hypothetical protein D9757_009876 [Collybiopsis confluens]|uniref:DNA2/NAM7 helicase-like C-terminal domain-containing protein n=1 Tax=Collybiopsis confluens TaxID=2823264 RepID=A0A8H5LVH2_9AGAR|nr:hypothetical protein D9757_009876 [Collybiopsis confluens]
MFSACMENVFIYGEKPQSFFNMLLFEDKGIQECFENALPLSPKQISVHRHTRQQAASVIAGLRLDPSSIVGISISLKDKGALDHIALATNKDDVHVIDANGPSSKKTDKQLFKILGSCTLAGFMMARIAIRLHHHFQQHVQGVDLSTTFFNSSEAAGHPSAVIRRSGLCQLTDTFPVDSLWHGNDTKHAVKKLCLRAWISAQVANHKESLPSLRGAKKVDTKVVQENILLCLGTLVKQNDILARAQPRVLKNEFDALKFNKQGNMVLHNSRFKTRVRLNKDRQSYVEVKNKDGSVFKGRTIGGEGKKTKISFGGALSKTKTPKSISVVGLEDPTAAEKAQESLLLMILQGHVNVLDAPFVRYLWFRSKQDTKLLRLKSARSESNHRSGPYVAHLNSSQGDVVEAMTSTTGSPVVVVHGPPGTGKTTTISSAAEMWLNVYHEPVWIIGHSNVCVKNIAEKLLQRKVDFKLIVSKEFYVEWHEHIYKEIEKYLIRTDRLPKDRVAVSRMIGGSTVILSTLALLSNPALDDNGTFTIVPVENLVVDEASQIDVFDYMRAKERIKLEKVDTIVHLVKNYYRSKNFCVITPYDPQRAAIQNALKGAELPWEQVFNVDSFQGNEADYVLISVVRSNHVGFLQSLQRMNVMLTRCRSGMVVVSRQSFLQGVAKKTLVGKLCASWVDQQRRGKAWVSATDILNTRVVLPGSAVKNKSEGLVSKMSKLAI